LAAAGLLRASRHGGRADCGRWEDVAMPLSAWVVYALFALAAIALFRWRPPAEAAWAVFLGGWLLLPVGDWPPTPAGRFPYWITGLALPSDVGGSKAMLAPAMALLGSLVADPGRWRRLRPVPLDALPLLWCLAPLWTAPWHADPAPAPLAASAEALLAWGGPWWLGRLYAADAAGRTTLLHALRAAGVACLPIALLEAFTGPWLHDALYGPHPFRHDGEDRYLGFRPLGFFENGNQYGVWVALCALAGLALAKDRRGRWLAGVLVVQALAAQSVGAIVLMVVGAVLLALGPRPRRSWLVGLPLAAVLFAGVYASGRLPIHHWARDTAWGAKALTLSRTIGRASLAWRVSQDQKLAREATARPMVGSGRWDWFMTSGTRPWGLPLLLAGAYGLPALAAAFGMLLLPSWVWAWRRAGEYRADRADGRPAASLDATAALALLPLLTVGDALLNSFLFFPALAIAGGLAAKGGARDAEVARHSAGPSAKI
jgi:hypothetical protein